MPVKLPLNPKHPERICWGCDLYCPADDLACGNGTIRTQHPVELFGEDWLEWSIERSERKAARNLDGRSDSEDEISIEAARPLESCQR